MKVVSYICDICGRPIDANDLQKTTVAGNNVDLDTACFKTINALVADKVKWDAERAAVALKEAQAAEAEVKG